MKPLFAWWKNLRRQPLIKLGSRSRTRLSLETLEDRWAPATLVAPDLLTQSDTGRSAFDNITADVQPRFAGSTTSPAGTLLTLVIDDLPQGTFLITQSGGGTFTIQTQNPLAEGPHTVRFRDSRTLGLSSPLTITIALTLPVTATAPDLTAGTDTGDPTDNITNNTTPHFMIQGSVGSRLHLFVGSLETIVNATGLPQEVAVNVSGLPLDPLTPISAWVREEDAAGNLGPASSSLAILFDQQAPAAPTDVVLSEASDTGYLADDGLTQATMLVFMGTGEPGSHATLFVDGITWDSDIVGLDGLFELSAGPLASGPHQAWVTLTDPAGNAGPNSATVAVEIDTTAPVLSNLVITPSLLSPQGEGLGDSAELAFTLSEPTFVAVVFANDFNEQLGSESFGLLPAGDHLFDFSVLNLPDGLYFVRLYGLDLADNYTDEAEATFTIDTSPPAAGTITLAPGADSGSSPSDGITNSAGLQLMGAAEAGSTVVLLDNNVVLGNATMAPDGTWSFSAPLAEGTHTLYARATDAFGNQTLGEPFVITIDRTAPVVNAGLDRIGAEGSPITLTAQVTELHPGSAVWEMVSSSNGQAVPSSATAALTFTPVDDGVYVFRHRVTDVAGNVGTDLVTVTIADVAPTITVTAPASIEIGFPVTLTLAQSDPGADAVSSWHIVWGDGSSQDLPANTTSVSHTYVGGGTFAPRVSVVSEGTTHTVTGPTIRALSNLAPTLTATTAALAPIAEDTVSPSGARIADLVASLGVTDSLNSLKGLAITGTDNAHGSWQYTLAGNAWTPLGNVLETTARLLAADAATRIRFVPAANWFGATSLTVRAWDQTDVRANGAVANAHNFGGETSFSSQTASLTLAVTPVNDAPTLTLPAAQTVSLNRDLTFGSATGNAITVADSDATNVRVTLTADHGLLFMTSILALPIAPNVGTAQVVIEGPLNVVNDRLANLIFRPTPGYIGSASLAVVVNDLASVDSGGPLQVNGNIAINVINRAPTAIAALAYSGYLNTPLSVTASAVQAAFRDLDGHALTFRVSSPPSVGTVSMQTNGSFVYTPLTGYIGTVTFAIQAFDGLAYSTPTLVTLSIRNPFGLRR